jgi:DNA repair protein RecO (recombination protein O)
MAIHRSECYVLRKIPLRETSWIVTFLTPDHGKLKGIVKGARQPKSKWSHTFEPFTRAEIVYYEKLRSHLHLITDSSVISLHEKIRRELWLLSYASYLCELVDLLLEEHEAQTEVFALFDETLSALESGELQAHLAVRAFEWKLLKQLGLMPRLFDCMSCGEPTAGRILFNPAQGGVFCSRCRTRAAGGFFISGESIAAVRNFCDLPILQCTAVKEARVVENELEQISRRFIEQRTDRRIASLHFISELRTSLRN